MKRSGLIAPSSGLWSSPVVLVKKKDGSTRFCVDYREMNDVTKKDSFLLPGIDDILDTLAGTKWLSTLEEYSGYWQVEITDKVKEKIPSIFERLMKRKLKGLYWKICLVYLDDTIVVYV